MPTSTPSLIFNSKKGYSEIDQNNPIRWAIFKYQGNDTFVQQTGLFKCKDFFNDFVAKYHGADVSIYGMRTADNEVDAAGMFIGLWNITDQFIGNVERAINPKLQQELGIQLLPAQVGDTVLVFLPKVLFDSTYTISFLTLLIRACNDVKEWSCYEHLVSESLESLLVSNVSWFKEASLLPPEHLRKYWYYAGPAYNNEVIQNNNYSFSSMVHNNGVLGWKSAKGFAVTSAPAQATTAA